jgi:hypothetical protein
MLTTSAREAAAFCRTTTCDGHAGPCSTDPNTGCVNEGLPLFWSSKCESFAIQKDLAAGLSLADVRGAAERAFDAWQTAECPGSRKNPSIGFADFGVVDCDQVQFNENQGNANILVFRTHWPEDANPHHTLALTTVSFVDETGEILDADIEVNVDLSRVRPLSVSTPPAPDHNDLQAILTHESGHFIGLNHSLVDCSSDPDSCPTMSASYGSGSTAFRTLELDDRQAVCAAYPPGRDDPTRGSSCVPAHGFAVDCGDDSQITHSCSISAPGSQGTTRPWLLLLGLGVALRTARVRLRRRA